jgi:hypothetical protein
MAIVKIKLKYGRDSYSVEINDSVPYNSLITLFKKNLSIPESERCELIALNSLGLVDGSIWEIRKIGIDNEIVNFKKDE